MDQKNLLEDIKTFNDKSRAKTKEGKDKKWNTFDIVSALYEGRKLTLNAFWSGIFSIKKKQGKQGKSLKILSPKQMLQRLPIALAQAKAGNASENLLIDIDRLYIFCTEKKKLLKKYTTI